MAIRLLTCSYLGLQRQEWLVTTENIYCSYILGLACKFADPGLFIAAVT